MLVLTSDPGFAELLRTQVENLGCPCSVCDGYAEASSAIDWADAAVVDLAEEGFDHLARLRVDSPQLRILAVGPDPERAAEAETAGADRVLVEPFTIADLIESLRSLASEPAPEVIDLRAVEPVAAGDEEPWWAS
jgi:DNA-binding response OmpR family regulator